MEILPPFRTDCIANKRCVRRLHGWQNTTSGCLSKMEAPLEGPDAQPQLGCRLLHQGHCTCIISFSMSLGSVASPSAICAFCDSDLA